MKRIAFSTAALLVAAVLPVIPTELLADDVIHREVAISGRTDLPTGGVVGGIRSTTLEKNRVVFQAESWNANPDITALWNEEAGQIEPIVSTETLVPGSIIHFAGFEGHAQDGDATVFVGSYPEYCELGEPCGSIYVHEGGQYTFVVDTNQQLPGRNVDFERLAFPAIDNGQVAFLGGTKTSQYQSEYGVYADLGAGVRVVADWETMTPGGDRELEITRWDTNIAIEDGVVYFAADANGYDRSYYSWDTATETFSVLRDPNTQVPGSTTRFQQGWNDTYCGGTYAFTGEYESSHVGVFADFGDGLRKVVTESDLLPEMVSDGDVYFASLAACGDVVAFVAESYPGDRHELYMYRYSDDSLTIMLRRGDVLDGWIVQDIELDRTALSGESVAVRVTLRDIWATGLYVISLHRPLHPMLAASDMGGNGFDEVILLQQSLSALEYYAQVRDSYTGGMIATTPLGRLPVYDMALIDRPEGSQNLAVLLQEKTRRVRVDLIEPVSGDRSLRINLWNASEPIALAVVPDQNGNGFDEIAVVAEKDDVGVRVQLRDTGTGSKLSGYGLVQGVRPEALFAIGDTDASGSTELLALGPDESSGLIRSVIFEALSGSPVRSFTLGSATRAPLFDAKVVDDIDGDQVAELAVARERKATGKAGWQIWSLLTGTKTAANLRAMEVRRLRILGLEDLSGDGWPELGLLRVKPDRSTLFEVFDPVTRSRLARYKMMALEDGRNLVAVGDLNGNEAAEFVVEGDHFEMGLLEIRDCEDGTALRFYAVP